MITGGCPCPVGASLGDIDTVVCYESFGQIQKVAFQRLYKDNGEKNKFTSTAAITALASWTALMAADDSTKVVVSPYIQAPTSEAGAMRTFGGGNETLGGVEENIGREPTPFSAVLRKVPQSIIKQLKALQCEATGDGLGIYLFDENGVIEAIGSDVVGEYFPIPIRSLYVGDKTHGGLEAPDSNAISWTFLPNYSDDLKVVNPNFNPLTDLKPATP